MSVMKYTFFKYLEQSRVNKLYIFLYYRWFNYDNNKLNLFLYCVHPFIISIGLITKPLWIFRRINLVRRSRFIVFFRFVFKRFSVEKERSVFAINTGIVAKICTSLLIKGIDCLLHFFNILNAVKSFLIPSYLLVFSWYSLGYSSCLFKNDCHLCIKK